MLDIAITVGLTAKPTKMDLNRSFSWPADLERVDCHTRRLAANLLDILRPTLATLSHRENVYVALDAMAWTAAIILVGTEDRGALDFFTLALTQNLADLEDPSPPQTIPTPSVAPAVSERDER